MNLIIEPLSYVPLIGTFWWQVDLTEATFNGQSFLTDGNNAIIDSGTSLVMMPYNDLLALASLIANSSDDLVMICEYGLCFSPTSCSDFAEELSDVGFSMGTSQVFYLTPSQYLMEGSLFGNPNSCYLGLEGSGYGNQYVFGDVFLRYYYAVYDYGNSQIGLAKNCFY